RAYHDQEDVRRMFRDNAHFYVCGSSRIAKEVKAKSVEIIQAIREDLDASAAASYLEDLLKGRYATDVFD
ncbi:hypothetical protein V5O48_014637, partial [Marasmius crinis-equi]